MDSAGTDVHAPEEPAPADRGPNLVPGALDALVVAVWFVVAGLVGALVWWQVTTLPQVTKVGDAASLEPAELLKQVGIDGWFFVIAALGGLVSGVLLLIWRWRDPLLMVVLVALGGGLASWVMVHAGRALGPPDEIAALRGMKEGAQVPMQLELHAPGVAWMWSIFAVLGAIIYVWILRKPEDELS
ncbi:MAG: hypothetical protein ABWX73_02825 [Marmoricola sp.]